MNHRPSHILLPLLLLACAAAAAPAPRSSGVTGDIWDAAEKGNLAAVKSALAADPRSLNALQPTGLGRITFWSVSPMSSVAAPPDAGTPLMCALPWRPEDSARKLAVVRYLISRGADVDAGPPTGSTPLSWAIDYACNCPETLSILLKAGADPNKAVGHLIESAESGRSTVPILQQFVAHGLKPVPAAPFRRAGREWRSWADYADAAAVLWDGLGQEGAPTAAVRRELAAALRAAAPSEPVAGTVPADPPGPAGVEKGFRELPLPPGAWVVDASADLTRIYGLVPDGWRVTRAGMPDSVPAEFRQVRRWTQFAAVVWDAAGRELGRLAPWPEGPALCMSADGSTVAGKWDGRPVRWRVDKGLESVDLGAAEYLGGLAVSGDGRVAAGSHQKRGFIWREGEKVRYLPAYTKEYAAGGVSAISEDGTVLAVRHSSGRSSAAAGTYLPMRWSAEHGYFPLPKPSPRGSFLGREPLALSGDGSCVLTPWVDGAPRAHFYDWVAIDRSGASTRLPIPRNEPDPEVQSLSFDGSVVAIHWQQWYLFRRPRQGAPYRMETLPALWKRMGYPGGPFQPRGIVKLSRDGSRALAVCRADALGPCRYVICRTAAP